MKEEKKFMGISVDPLWHKKVKAEAALRELKISDMICEAVDEWLAKHPRWKLNDISDENRT